MEVMKIMVTSFKRSHDTLSVPDPAAGHTDQCLHQRLQDTHGHVWVSLLWGYCSFLLGPGAHKVLFVPSKSLSPQSYVSSGSSIVGLMATSLKRSHASLSAFDPAGGHCQPTPLPETPGHPWASLGQSLVGSLLLSPGSWCTQVSVCAL